MRLTFFGRRYSENVKIIVCQLGWEFLACMAVFSLWGKGETCTFIETSDAVLWSDRLAQGITVLAAGNPYQEKIKDVECYCLHVHITCILERISKPWNHTRQKFVLQQYAVRKVRTFEITHVCERRCELDCTVSHMRLKIYSRAETGCASELCRSFLQQS